MRQMLARIRVNNPTAMGVYMHIDPPHVESVQLDVTTRSIDEQPTTISRALYAAEIQNDIDDEEGKAQLPSSSGNPTKRDAMVEALMKFKIAEHVEKVRGHKHQPPSSSVEPSEKDTISRNTMKAVADMSSERGPFEARLARITGIWFPTTDSLKWHPLLMLSKLDRLQKSEQWTNEQALAWLEDKLGEAVSELEVDESSEAAETVRLRGGGDGRLSPAGEQEGSQTESSNEADERELRLPVVYPRSCKSHQQKKSHLRLMSEVLRPFE